MEADPRHSELVIEQLSLGDANGVVTPGIREENDVEEGGDGSQQLEGNDITMFRRVDAGCNYLAPEK